MFVTYDADVDALYVSFRPETEGDVARSAHLDVQRNVDYNAAGEPLGAEFLDASEGVELQDIPRAEEIRAVLQRIPRGDSVRLRSTG